MALCGAKGYKLRPMWASRELSRKLFFVPIVHSSNDMGSVASFLESEAAAVIGQEAWENHEALVGQFWDAIAAFFSGVDVRGFKIYQDGLVAGAEKALKIVQEGSKQGSQNYAVIMDLVARGALLVQTEDISLVKKEYAYITAVANAKSAAERERALIRYKQMQAPLLQRRDQFVAQRINQTLNEGETGILFMGAHHKVLNFLPEDIAVVRVDETEEMRPYRSLLAQAAKGQ